MPWETTVGVGHYKLASAYDIFIAAEGMRCNVGEIRCDYRGGGG